MIRLLSPVDDHSIASSFVRRHIHCIAIHPFTFIQHFGEWRDVAHGLVRACIRLVCLPTRLAGARSVCREMTESNCASTPRGERALAMIVIRISFSTLLNAGPASTQRMPTVAQRLRLHRPGLFPNLVRIRRSGKLRYPSRLRPLSSAAHGTTFRHKCHYQGRFACGGDPSCGRCGAQ